MANRTQWWPYWESQDFVFGSSVVLFELVQVNVYVYFGSPARSPVIECTFLRRHFLMRPRALVSV